MKRPLGPAVALQGEYSPDGCIPLACGVVLFGAEVQLSQCHLAGTLVAMQS